MDFILKHIKIITIIVAAIISLLVLCYMLSYKDSDLEKLRERQQRALREKDIKKREAINAQRQLLKVERKEKFIKATGLYHMTKGNLTYKQYRMICIVITTLFALIGFSLFDFIGMSIGMLIGLFAPTLILKANNEQDNTNMLDSIKQVYDTLRIQASNDIYITDALQECYIVTQHPRLKAAFYELITEIHTKSDVDEAVDNFNDKFNNPFIDALSMSIRQSLSTGNATQIFNDISKQMDAIDQAILIREEEKAKRLNTVVQALVYLGIMIMVFYFAILAALPIFSLL